MCSLSNNFSVDPAIATKTLSRLELVFKRNGEGVTYLDRQFARRQRPSVKLAAAIFNNDARHADVGGKAIIDLHMRPAGETGPE
jgi:hypothetical protein